MKNKALSRRDREKLRQRQEMLSAALELFSEKGYHNVPMHEIAEKAEFAIGTLYKFFRNKEDLYRTLILENTDRFHEALTKALEETDDEVEKLRNYVRAKGEVFRANASVIRLYLAETQGAKFNVMVGFDADIRERYGKFLQSLALVFEAGIKKKRFKRIADPYHLSVSLVNLTNAFLFLWLEEPEHHPYPEDPDTVLNILFKGLLDQ
ncbi:MAG: TetR/AcrR family transcriptional regulator [Deltaproteobacteria bacterium]|nr:TetR/AcrR family transcriptional regulator [Deltaproteobacteria bacterium]